MKSDVIEIRDEDKNLEKILAETEKSAVYSGLEKAQSERLRLLAEELVEMLPSLLEFSTGKFWVESEEKKFTLHTSLVPNESLTAQRREELLAVSTTGKNEAARGIMAKIKLAAQFMLIDYEKTASLAMPFYNDGIVNSPSPSLMWSLDMYRTNARQNKGEDWDELERSIVANLADDVLVGLRGNQVDILVKKAF